MDIQNLGISAQQLFILLFLGLGPIRIVLAWMNIAPGLNTLEQRQVAWRITWVSMVMVVGSCSWVSLLSRTLPHGGN